MRGFPDARLERECYYPAKFQFIDGSVKSQSSLPSAGWHVSVPSKRKAYTFTTQKYTDSGALVQKWHRTSLPLEPALAQADRLSMHFIECLEQGRMGARMKWIGSWTALLPQRIGSSPTLDQSARLMVSTHTAILRNRNPSAWIDVEAYAQAIGSLRKALTDPAECLSSETLVAATILYYLEAILSCPHSFNSIHHAGGIARLLEVRGPVDLKSKFELTILRELRGPVISRAVVLGVPCFLTSPQWTAVFDIGDIGSRRAPWAQKLANQFVNWPKFTMEIRKYCDGQLSLAATSELRDQLSTMKLFLNFINSEIEDDLASEEHVTQVKSTRQPTSFATVFEYKDYFFATLAMLHASFSLIIERMICVLSENAAPTLSARWENPQWTAENPQLLARICQSYEYAWKMRPMGAAFMHVPLTMAFSYAETEAMRAWALRAINDLDEHRLLAKERFTDASVTHLAQLYTGEVAPVAAPYP
ncbi:hypothetical protein K432DRAFT_387145 [Lepidopterella palustris CBS 459.81]|uniref:Transcription factor domain-containing protein n=1 Tax=Lepidopterella palustris CBS 459.81 TaxID=1314670 RepID=A0A8E2DYE1_9PEZI|nr:hypothetical protein K432DRAFT_387145 [Lepidopterella palustris CBS 459.81]